VKLKSIVHILTGITLRLGFHDWVITAVGASGSEEEVCRRVGCGRGRPPASEVDGIPRSFIINCGELLDWTPLSRGSNIYEIFIQYPQAMSDRQFYFFEYASLVPLQLLAVLPLKIARLTLLDSDYTGLVMLKL